MASEKNSLKTASLNQSLFKDILERNSKSKSDVRKILRTYGMTDGEIALLGAGQEGEETSEVDKIREEILLSHRIRQRLLWDMRTEDNTLLIISKLQEEEKHVADLLLRLGMIPSAQKPATTIQKQQNNTAIITLESLIAMSGEPNGTSPDHSILPK